MNELTTFSYESHDIRTLEKDGEPWFVLRDVCTVLELGTPAKVAERLDEDEKGVNQIHTPGGRQEMTIINESGLYNVILRSDKPEAKPFRKWVTSEVLPSIRKHGASNELMTFENPEFGKVRTVEIDGEPWLVGKDVAEILGYANPNEALADHVDDEDKLNSKTLSSFSLNLGQRGGWLINESGLYALVLSSKLPGAKKFKRWVTSEVLPSIRKTGTYTVRTAPEASPLESKRLAIEELSVKSRIADQMMQLWTAAGVTPQYQAAAMQDYYPGLSLPRQALAGQVPAMLDATTIARHLGLLSKNGTPHAQAVTAIIHQLEPLSEGEYAMTPYTRNGHDGISIQYTERVERKAADWLAVHGYPTTISDGKKSYAVRYSRQRTV